MTSFERVETLLDGSLPDRPPLYDVIRNDAIIEHFAGRALMRETAQQTVIDAHRAALDATKPFFRLPEFEPGRTEARDDGRGVTYQRWTTWTEHAVYASADEYVGEKEKQTAGSWDWCAVDDEVLRTTTERWNALNAASGDLVMEFGLPGPPTLDGMFSEVGLEAFSYLIADCPDQLHRQIAHRYEKIIQALQHLPGPSAERSEDAPPPALVINESCDMAYKTGLIFPPSFLRESLVPGYRDLCIAAHERGWKVLFHSDGDLNEILDDLVDAGIDLLHPLEPLAGMDPREIHRRYPDLILCGSIDVSQLLPFGTPQQVADRVKRNIEDTEGKIMVGSSTEVNNDVPLENYLALHQTVLEYSY